MTGADPSARARLDRLGPIRRARGYRLYDHRGRRYLDLWQAGGRALLGHRPGGAVARIKGVLSSAPHAGLPSVYERRLLGRLRRLVPGFEPILAACGAEARAVLDAAGLGGEALFDPALDAGPADARRAGLWRPAAGPAPLPERWRAVAPVLPFTLGPAPAPVCLRPDAAPALPEARAALTLTPLPAALLAAALAGLDRLPRYGAAAWAAQAWPDPHGCAGWERRGPYVAARCAAAAYDGLFDRFLQAGAVLSPFHPGPSILPDEVSAGEAAALMRLFAG